MRFCLISALALGVAAACSPSGLPHEPPTGDPTLLAGSLIASAGPNGVILENRGSGTVRFSVVDSLFFENGLRRGASARTTAERRSPPESAA